MGFSELHLSLHAREVQEELHAMARNFPDSNGYEPGCPADDPSQRYLFRALAGSDYVAGEVSHMVDRGGVPEPKLSSSFRKDLREQQLGGTNTERVEAVMRCMANRLIGTCAKVDGPSYLYIKGVSSGKKND